MKTKNLLLLLNIAFIAMFVLMSCSKEEKDDLEKTENISVQDPEGTVVLNMNSGTDDNWYMIGDIGRIHIDASNNFRGRDSDISFVSVGLVSGLSKITQIPTSGWAESAAVVSGTGYLMRYSYYGTVKYARIYVVEYLGTTFTDEQGNTYGQTTGAKIKYQAPFQLPIKFDSTTLTFTSDGGSQTILFVDPTSATIEEKPLWCDVSIKENGITVTVPENLTASQRTGIIILKNTANSVTINVTQKGASSPLFQAGSGTEQDPYQISTAQQLKNISKALNAHFILTSDITLNEEENGSGWDPIGKQETPFTGTFDGQGHSIKNIWMKRPTTNGVGLFGYIARATITGVCLETSDIGINGGQGVGGICGNASNPSIISKCSISGLLNGNDNVGGICGEGNTNSHYSIHTTISECYSKGSIKSDGDVAGILGYANSNYFDISNCYSVASISGKYCSGIRRYSGTVTKCYYAGKAILQSDEWGYYYGYFNCDGSYTYFDKNIIVAERVDNASLNNARTTAQLMTQSNYEGWDFTNIWKITEGRTYPTLRCFDK